MIEKIRNYNEKKQRISRKIWFQIPNQLLNIFLALVSVLPLLYYICTKIPFSYEVNDDAVIAQILDGSYTGTPDAHAIFVKYPLSWIIALLYKKNPVIDIWRIHLINVNWYVGTIVILTGFALFVVLYRLLNHFKCNRFLICILYDLAFIFIWLPCFSKLTFSTASAFLGCMSLLYFGLENRHQAWKPWNLLVLGILVTASYCLRHSSFYMVIPFLIAEFLFKYHIFLFKSIKPWIFVCFMALLCGGILFMNEKEYKSSEWQNYFTYNHARAYMQDYEGFPDYEENQEFYDAAGISQEQLKTMTDYNYCLVDDFKTEWITQTYTYKNSNEEKLSWKDKIEKSWHKAVKYACESKQAPYYLRFFSFYLWLVLIPLIPITLILRFRSGFGQLILYVLETGAFGVLVAAEWIYLAIRGRYPSRVEECIRLMMLTAALLMICHFLESYHQVWMCRIHGILQIVLILVLFRPVSTQFMSVVNEIQGKQQYQQIYAAEKGEIFRYCGSHPENYYILETKSFIRGSLPSDDTKQMNWIMSGSWIAFSPLYTQKLKTMDTDSLGTDFLLRKNVYIITRGKKKIEKLLGLPEDSVEYKIVDEYCSEENTFFEIYKVTGIN